MSRKLVRVFVIAALLALLTATNASAQVCGSLSLTSQAQVNLVSCSSVTGGVSISGADITNLDPLSTLTSVGGNLIVLSNLTLTSLDGLAGITSVGGHLSVRTNAVLDSFCGLFPLFDAGGLGSFYSVGFNATNPTEGEILAAGPCFVPVVPTVSPVGLLALLSGLGLAGCWGQLNRTSARRRLN